MYLPDLITSVPDLQTARILAAAGVDYIAFHQNIENLEEIKPWLEGPQIGVEITDPDLSLPNADFLIMPLQWYDLFSFSNRPILWKTEENTVQTSENLLFVKGSRMEESEPTAGIRFYHYSDYTDSEAITAKSWLDYKDDLVLFEKLFL
jgi:hypothetical protein